MRNLIKVIAIFAATFSAVPSHGAGQNFAVVANGEVIFDVSTIGITRVSFTNDRIRRVVHGETDFEMTNDEATGDVFMRFVGREAESETGYFVTESGITIGYTLLPVDKNVQPILIRINGLEEEVSSGDEGDFGAEVGFSDNVATAMTDIVREVAQQNVLGRDVPSGRDGRRIKTVTGEGWKADVMIAVAGTDGRLVREQDFYRPGVLAVWIANTQLGPNERTWLVVVRGE